MKYSFLIFGLAIGLFACQEAPKSEESGGADAPMTHDDWSKNATIYEVNVRQYTPEGTLNAFAEDLPRIKEMGIDILWLMPIYPIGELNRKGGSGSYYSIQDYKAVNPEFGTMEDFEALVKKAHDLDMKVILDWVANHSSFDNVWVADHKNYYNLDSLGNLQMPEGTDWSDVADLDYDNPELRTAMIDALQFWVRETGIDGYRCDVAGFVPTDFWEAARDSLEAIKPDIFMLAEWEDPAHHEKAFDMSYGWEFLHVINGVAKGEKELSAFDEYMAKQDTLFPKEAYRMYFTTNHDENSWNGAVMERYGEEGHKTFAVLAYTFSGMPLLYSGQDAGMDSALEFFEKDTIDWGDYELQEFYTKLLKLNQSNEALWNGEYGGDFERLTTNADDKIYAYKRQKGDDAVVVILNFSDKAADVNFDKLPEMEMMSLFDEVEYTSLSEGVELAPFTYHVFHTP
ncbi:MAG: glycosidase [Cryomorphaceae bacterium]|jgi:glycosidase